jgi:hypothetical protein
VRALCSRDRNERGRFRVGIVTWAGDPLERAVAIVSLVRGILWAHMSIVMYNIHVGEYGSHMGHVE